MNAYLQDEWGLKVAVDFFLGGSGAGLLGIYLLMTLVEGRPANISINYVLVGIVLLIIGLLTLISELGRPDRFWRSLTNWKTSWMSRGSLFNLVLVLCSSILYLTSGAIPTILLPLIWVTFASSLLVMAYPGFLLYDVHDIGLWRLPLLPVLMFLYSLLSGVSMLILITTPSGESLPFLPPIGASIVVALDILLLVTLKMMKTSRKQSVLASYQRLTKGKMAIPFIVGVVALGTIVPTACFVFQAMYPGTIARGLVVVETGAVASLLGAFLFKYSMLKAAFHEPLKIMKEQ